MEEEDAQDILPVASKSKIEDDSDSDDHGVFGECTIAEVGC